MIVGSCLSDPYYTVVAALSALRGPLLGGAGERVLHQLLQHDGPESARRWVREALRRGERLAGFGHRIYRGADPRVEILRAEASALAAERGQRRLLDVARAIEEEASRLLASSGVAVNAYFYAALLFHLLGSSPALVPCLYAVGKVVGIVARVREYLTRNRLFRPRSRYVGPATRGFEPLEQRR
jgi:citrate synthase